MAYPEQVARSFSLFVSGLSLSPTKFLQLIVFAAAVMGVTYVLGGCDLGEFTRLISVCACAYWLNFVIDKRLSLL